MITTAAALRARIKAPGLITAPGVYDMISARIADKMGFPALYMTGFGVVASYLGLPDAGLATYTDMAGRVNQICAITQTPLIADADTGYGGLLNVAHTVRGYIKAGAAALQIEDQEFPKKCGHTPGRRVIPLADMVKKIRVAVEARGADDILIVARTDARTTLGIDEAIARGKRFAAAGADVVFVKSPETPDEMRAVCREVPAPCLANLVEGGRTPHLPQDELAAIGYRVAIYPNALTRAFARAGQDLLEEIKRTGTSAGMPPRMLTHGELWDLFGRREWNAQEPRFVRDVGFKQET